MRSNNEEFRKARPLLGVLGGMGTQATACFYSILHDMQNVTAEQEYLDVLIYSMPSIPDRTAFITGQSIDSPLGPLLHAAKALETAGASLLAMLCVTAHYFYDDLSGAVGIPFLSIPEETARLAHGHGIGKIGMLATDGALKGKVFQSALEKYGIEMLVPPEDSRAGLMKMIYEIKRGADVSPEFLDKVVRRLRKNGAEAVILGCTELCIIAKGSPGVINTLEVLAGASLRAARALVT